MCRFVQKTIFRIWVNMATRGRYRRWVQVNPIPNGPGAGDHRQWVLDGTGIFFVPNDLLFSKDAVVRLFDFATRKSFQFAAVGSLSAPVAARPQYRAMKLNLLHIRMDRNNRYLMLAESSR